jgi:hypothetical protein
VKHKDSMREIEKESIKDEESSRKVHIKTIIFSIVLVGIDLMVVAYLLGYLTMG